MRPLGHNDARAGRDTHAYAGLLDAWEEYYAKSELVLEPDARLENALTIIEPFRPTLAQLDHLLIVRPDVLKSGGRSGVFLTAVYQLVPETTIHYTHEQEWVHYLGHRLTGKHLIIDGVAGHKVGTDLRGQLTINGAVGDEAGAYMLGELVNNGNAGPRLGRGMIGRLTNNHLCRYDAAGSMIGVLENYGHMGAGVGLESIGLVRNRGTIVRTRRRRISWTIPKTDRKRFLKDITNPEGLSYDALHDRLTTEYGGWE